MTHRIPVTPRRLALVAPFVLVLVAGTAEARPPYLAALEADPMRRPDVGGCGTCHVSPTGGGARNEFGAAFDAAGREISPLFRAAHPQQFRFETVRLADGSTFSFSDPASKVVVFERAGQKVVVELEALTADKVAPVPPPSNRMGFFVTSTTSGTGGKLGGLAGADRWCQDLAKAAGAGERTWRAYLSTSFEDRPALNAGDRIGAGPWYDAKGVLVAKGPIDLHTTARLDAARLLTERGEPVPTSGLEILTGSLPNGTPAIGRTCENWTGLEGRAEAGPGAGAWNSGHDVACTTPDTGARVRLYCFAAR
ncbi:MAG: hypothetical protein U0Q12_20040 [Vicinamibacterales bacterium]